MRHYLIHQQHGLKRQSGATLIGMVLVGAALVFVALVAMKVFPAYTEYFSVRTVIHAMGKESLSTMSKKEIMDSFNKRSSTAYIDVVKGNDLTIGKNSAGDTVVSVEYQVVKPIMGNVSVLIDFATSSDDK
ncbi:MAG: DUF4845 domain-containing protein [Methylotenera sp.]